jgi:hypothetical protein
MPKAYFIKINNDTTWANIVNAIKVQIANSRKQLEYNSIIELSIDKSDFDSLATSICKPHTLYSKWCSASLANDNGIWNCITISCKHDKRKMVIYTAGRTFPLYASVE